MPQLLEALGFSVSEGTKRCCCVLHGGENPTAFSWTDQGLWKCHSCGAGGDEIALVKAVRNCSFAEAVRFIESLTGAKVEWNNRNQVRKVEDRAARFLVNAEHELLLDQANELDVLRTIRRRAGTALAQGSKDPETYWVALAFVATALRRADAAYCVVAFGTPLERARFVLHPEFRSEIVDAVLECGFVVDAKGNVFEVALQ